VPADDDDDDDAFCADARGHKNYGILQCDTAEFQTVRPSM